MNNKVSIFFIQQLILVSTKLHLKCWISGWNPLISVEKEPAGRRPSLGSEIWELLKNWGVPTSDETRRTEAQLSPDAEVAWPIGPFISDSMSEKLQIGFHIHECSREERDDRKNNS